MSAVFVWLGGGFRTVSLMRITIRDRTKQIMVTTDQVFQTWMCLEKGCLFAMPDLFCYSADSSVFSDRQNAAPIARQVSPSRSRRILSAQAKKSTSCCARILRIDWMPRDLPRLYLLIHNTL